MNSDSMPKELDVFISILGEIDMIKNQIGMLDKNTHISLSQNDVSAILGNSECFKILKLIEVLLSLIHISEPTRLRRLKKIKKKMRL